MFPDPPTECCNRLRWAQARIAELEAREQCNDSGPCTCNWRAVQAEAKVQTLTEWLDRANELGNNMTIGLGRAARERDEAIELCREMIGYIPDYFREKWGMDEALARLTGEGRP